MKEYGLGSNEEILTFERGEDATIRTKAVLLHHVPIPYRIANINVGPNDNVITTWSRLMTDTCFEIKIFFLLDGFCI
jgi:hypothetical protein